MSTEAIPAASARVSATPALRDATRLGYVDGLRALAALYVVVVHMGQTVWPGAHPTGLDGWISAALVYGHFAVSIFIILSGYSLMLPVARNGYVLPQGMWGFYLRRARRIVPPYYLAMGFSLMLIWLAVSKPTGAFWDMSIPVTFQDIVAHLLLIHDFSLHGDFRINYVFWSIAVECQVYLFFPALVALWRRYPALVALALSLGASFGLLVITLATSLTGLVPPASGAYVAPYIGLFAMGMFAASLRGASAPIWRFLHIWRVWETAALVGFALLVTNVAAWSIYALDLCAGIMGVSALMAASRYGFNPLRAILEWRPLVWVGGFSYSLYLIHAPLIQALWQYAVRPLGWSDVATYLALLILGTPLMLLAAWGFWYVCERPFLNSRPSSTRLSWPWRRAEAPQTGAAR